MDITPRIFLNLMRQVKLLRGFTQDQGQAILSVCEQVEIKSGQVLIEEGTQGQEMYLLLSGKMEASRKDNKLPLAHITPVGVIGEIAMFLDLPRTATVTAGEQSQLLKLSKENMLLLFKNDAQIELTLYRNMCYILCEKLLKNNIHIEEYRLLQRPGSQK